jgi:hypothetical protein
MPDPTGYNPGTQTVGDALDWIFLDPRGTRPILTDEGYELAAPLRILAHELGHVAIGGHKWFCDDDVEVINWIENPMPYRLFPEDPRDTQLTCVNLRDAGRHRRPN